MKSQFLIRGSLVLILLGLMIGLLGIILSSGYSSKEGLFSNIEVMKIVLKSKKMIPFFEKVDIAESYHNGQIIEVNNDDKTVTTYVFPKDMALDTIAGILTSRYENKKINYGANKYRFVEWYSSGNEISIGTKYVLSVGVILAFFGFIVLALIIKQKSRGGD